MCPCLCSRPLWVPFRVSSTASSTAGSETVFDRRSQSPVIFSAPTEQLLPHSHCRTLIRVQRKVLCKKWIGCQELTYVFGRCHMLLFWVTSLIYPCIHMKCMITGCRSDDETCYNQKKLYWTKTSLSYTQTHTHTHTHMHTHTYMHTHTHTHSDNAHNTYTNNLTSLITDRHAYF